MLSQHNQISCFVIKSTVCKPLQKMKEEHSQLSREAHDCTDSIPDLTKMVSAVQMLGELDIKLSLWFCNISGGYLNVFVFSCSV